MDRIIAVTEIINGVVQDDERYLRLSTIENIRLTTVHPPQSPTAAGPLQIQAAVLQTAQGSLWVKYPFQIAIPWAQLFDATFAAELAMRYQSWLLQTFHSFFITGLSQDPELLAQDGRYEGSYNGCTTTGEYWRRSAANQRVVTYHIGMASGHIRQILTQSGVALSPAALGQVLALLGIQAVAPAESIGDVYIAANVSHTLDGQLQWFLDEAPSSQA